MEQNQIALLGATRFAVGLSAIIKMTPSAYQYAENIKIVSGGGTLEIVGTPVALTGASALGWGTGYMIGATESVAVNGPAAMYFAASGATMVASMLIGYTNGAQII